MLFRSVDIFGWVDIGNPFIITQIVGFLVFLTATQAELAQQPFDMPVAESEIVTGYMTEYSGIRFLLFFIGEFATAGAFSAIASSEERGVGKECVSTCRSRCAPYL